MALSILGSPQIVEKPDGSEYTLHDPFLASVLDFIRRSLDQLARALHITVVHTFKYRLKRRGFDQGEFFKGANNEFVNPCSHPSSHDVFYLLKNLRYFSEDVYAEALDVDSEDINTNVDFLLDTIRNHVAHQSYLGCERNENFATNPDCNLWKYDTTQECLDKCIDLLDWFIDARFYKAVRGKVRPLRNNMENMKDVLEDHQCYRQAMEEAEDRSLDTRQAKGLLRKLLRDLDREENAPEKIEERPITHAVNMLLGPRIQRH